MTKGLEYYAEAFANLHANRRGGHISPHKSVMLLTILSLAENGRLPVNRIEYGPQLLEIFREYFEVVRTDQDQCTPFLPFFFLRGDKFWHHQPLPGQEKVYRAFNEPGSPANLRRVVAYAYLDDELFQIVATAEGREVLRDTLINRYFPDRRRQLLAIRRREDAIADYQRRMEQQTDGTGSEKRGEDYEKDVRDAAFRRTVTSAYDYRCAACGFRVILDDLVLVDAAHLIPFSESHDDDPCNGMALCKNHHWAMDNDLIVPCTDRKWHVSARLDTRIPELAPLVDLDDKGILLPSKQRYWPKEESLRWRMNRMKRSA